MGGRIGRRALSLLAMLLVVALAGYAVPAAASGASTEVEVHGYDVTVSCTGRSAPGDPTVILLAGMPDPLTIFEPLQATLSRHLRVCSYDRLGEGTSDAPRRPQTLRDSARILHGVLRQVVPRREDVVLVGHSLGGLVAASYAHRYPRDVHAVVLLDATPPSVVQGVLDLIPADATGIAAEVRGEMSSLVSGDNPERLVYDGDPIGSLHGVPLTVVEHGLPIFSAVPDYGDGLQRLWSAGQRQWLALSCRSRLVTARTSGHYIYLDQPRLTVRLVKRAAR
jgi:pimeloyl-ACP methyl ester carboxylesterase